MANIFHLADDNAIEELLLNKDSINTKYDRNYSEFTKTLAWWNKTFISLA